MKDLLLYKILHNIKLQKQTTTELNLLIKHSYQISLSFLKSRFPADNPFLKTESLSLEDLAMDAIVPLFVNNSEGILGLNRAIKLWDKKIDNEANAEFFLAQIIWKRTEQTITSLLKERDPIFEKILKTLSVCIVNNELKKIYHFGTVFIVKKKVRLITGEILTDDFFTNIPLSFFKLKQISLFNKLFEYIENESDFFPAIPLNKLVKRVKLFHFQSYKNNYSNNKNFNDEFIYKEIINRSLKIIDTKLSTFYVGKNKISRKEADYIMNSFFDIALDATNGGIHGSLYSYLYKNNPKLSQKEFYTKYHNIMNYLFNQFKTEIIKNFE